jgi:aminopeptidase
MALDPRIERYAALLVDECVDVQPGWQVLVRTQPAARPLYEAVVRRIAERGAYAFPRVGFSSATAWDPAWLQHAPGELIDEVPGIERYTLEHVDCLMAILAPENTRDGLDVPPERMARIQKAYRTLTEPFMRHEKAWVGCQYPTQALAQDAGMTLEQFEDFLYGAVLIDWAALEKDMRKIADRFDAGDRVRIVADGTELTLRLGERTGRVGAIGSNMPGGEVFYSPIEDSAEGEITFGEFPGCYLGHQVSGIRLRFRDGRVVDASADTDEEFLLGVLDTDDGARRLGEFGIGCNPGIQQHMRNTLFDEKIEGTVHLALGQSYPDTGGTNESAIHWDIVKDLRNGGRIELDGDVVQRDGAWHLA